MNCKQRGRRRRFLLPSRARAWAPGGAAHFGGSGWPGACARLAAAPARRELFLPAARLLRGGLAGGGGGGRPLRGLVAPAAGSGRRGGFRGCAVDSFGKRVGAGVTWHFCARAAGDVWAITQQRGRRRLAGWRAGWRRGSSRRRLGGKQTSPLATDFQGRGRTSGRGSVAACASRPGSLAECGGTRPPPRPARDPFGRSSGRRMGGGLTLPACLPASSPCPPLLGGLQSPGRLADLTEL